MAVNKVAQQEVQQLVAHATKQHASKGAGPASFSEAMRQAQQATQAAQVQANQHIQLSQLSRSHLTHSVRSIRPNSAIQQSRSIRASKTTASRSGAVSSQAQTEVIETAGSHVASRTPAQANMIMQTTLFQGLKLKDRDKDEEEG